MINAEFFNGVYFENGKERLLSNNFNIGYAELVDTSFFHLEVDGGIEGRRLIEYTLNGNHYESSEEVVFQIRSILNYEHIVP